MIKDAEDQVVYQIVDCLRAMVETRTCRNNVRACTSQPQHVLEMNSVIGSLTRHNHKPASFLERDICCAMNEICSGPGSNRSERSH